MIPGANHNDIFLKGMGEYMEAVEALSNEAVCRGEE
jgi:hypothetical protein